MSNTAVALKNPSDSIPSLRRTLWNKYSTASGKIVQNRWKTAILTAVCRHADDIKIDAQYAVPDNFHVRCTHKIKRFICRVLSDNTYSIRSQRYRDSVICLVDFTTGSAGLAGRSRHSALSLIQCTAAAVQFGSDAESINGLTKAPDHETASLQDMVTRGSRGDAGTDSTLTSVSPRRPSPKTAKRFARRMFCCCAMDIDRDV